MDTAPGPVPVYRALSHLLLFPAVEADSWNWSTNVDELHEDIDHGHLSLHTTRV